MAEALSNSNLLRKSMQFNGFFSGFSALVCLIFAESIALTMGFGAEGSGEILSQGISLLIFSAFLFITSSKLTENKRSVLIISGSVAILLDMVWVIGSAHVLVNDVLSISTPGKWIVAIIAVFVLDFAILQSLGLKRMLTSK